MCSGVKLCFEDWNSAEEDCEKAPKVWSDDAGDVLFYWDRKYLGTTVITRLFESDGSQEIRSSLIRKVYDGAEFDEPNVEFITPNDANPDTRYWSLPWSRLQGHVMVLTWDVCKRDLNIDVCVKFFKKRNCVFFTIFWSENVFGQFFDPETFLYNFLVQNRFCTIF